MVPQVDHWQISKAKDTWKVPLAAQRHRHGPHHRALSRPGAVYQPRADVAGLAELTCGSDEAGQDGNRDGHGDTTSNRTKRNDGD
jgi:hypothetical protein